jgi:hypothetical protein
LTPATLQRPPGEQGRVSRMVVFDVFAKGTELHSDDVH